VLSSKYQWLDFIEHLFWAAKVLFFTGERVAAGRNATKRSFKAGVNILIYKNIIGFYMQLVVPVELIRLTTEGRQH
jgi:hypothetical protein